VRIVIYGALALLATILQMGLVPHVLVLGQGPTLVVVVVVAVGLLYGPTEGVWAGGVAGALTDLLLGGPWGLATLAYMAVGYVSGRFAWARGRVRAAAALVLSAAAAAAVRAVGIVALRAGGGHVWLPGLVPGPEGLVYTAVLTPFLIAVLDGRVGPSRRAAQTHET